MGAREFRFGLAVGQVPSRDTLLGTVMRAEQLGYASLLVADGLWLPSPFGLLNAAAAVTSTLRVGTHVLATPLRAAAATAQETETLDVVSGHRFELGLGTGQPGVSADAELLGRSFGTRAERLAAVSATLDAVEQRFAATDTEPPPVLLAGVGRKMVELAVERADTLALPAPFDHTEDHLAEVVATLRRHTDGRVDRLELAASVFAVGDKDLPEWVPTYFRPSADSYVGLPGNPRQIADRLRRRRDRTGISYLSIPQWHLDDFAPVVELLAGR